MRFNIFVLIASLIALLLTYGCKSAEQRAFENETARIKFNQRCKDIGQYLGVSVITERHGPLNDGTDPYLSYTCHVLDKYDQGLYIEASEIRGFEKGMGMRDYLNIINKKPDENQ